MPPLFPEPVNVGQRRLWRESDIVNYDRALQGLPPVERDEADERWLPSSYIRRRYNCSDMWIYRRLVATRSHRAALERSHRHEPQK